MTQVLQGDALTVLRTMPDESVQCCVTSPPYWGLRDYGVDSQLGLEPTPEEYVAKIVEVFREVRRVLRQDGTLWLNLGDSYASDIKGSGGQGKSGLRRDGRPEVGRLRTADQSIDHQKMTPRRLEHGLKPKDLVGIPWRVAFALQADGWYLRSDIIWAKPNPMPESVTDRPTKAHEYLFLLSKSERYFYDADAIAEPSLQRGGVVQQTGQHKVFDGRGNGASALSTLGTNQGTMSRNRRTVWTIATQPYAEAHFATYPEALVEPCIKAGTSAKGCCPECGAPWERVVDVGYDGGGRRRYTDGAERAVGPMARPGLDGANHSQFVKARMGKSKSTTTGWQRTCTHFAEPVACTVLDPFAGSGTTLTVAKRLGREYLGIELNSDYIRLAEKRIRHATHQPELFEATA